MRVIAGTYGGRTLKAPPGDGTRPTSDRVRESLFSILGDRTHDSRVLDLFAGSGALGLEALSRGAIDVTFVDDDRGAITAIKGNLAALKATAHVRQSDALKFLHAASTGGAQYDLVFLDPPYRLAERLAPPLSEALPAVLAPGAVAVAESDRRAPLALDLPLKDERRYGDTLIRIYGP
ncbi:MAG TPA: 16S rRNA (guanine(966)-N(2))-methyltransferase RsmD [Solirubrobacter sp.]